MNQSTILRDSMVLVGDRSALGGFERPLLRLAGNDRTKHSKSRFA